MNKYFPRKSFLTGITLLCLNLVIAQTDGSDLKNYVSSDGSFQFSYPGNWKKYPYNVEGIKVQFYKVDENNNDNSVLISVDSIKNGYDVKNLKSDMQKYVTSLSPSKVIKLEDKNYGSSPGVYAEYIAGNPNKLFLAWTIIKDKQNIFILYQTSKINDVADRNTGVNIISSLTLPGGKEANSAVIKDVAPKLSPGDISPNVKVLDVDELFGFQDGVAIVRKGTSVALIDEMGKFIVPFNKYESLTQGPRGSNILIASIKHEPRYFIGLINTKGKELLDFRDGDYSFLFDKDGFALVVPPSGKSAENFVFVDSEGKKINSSNSQVLVFATWGSNGLCPVSNTKGKYGYIDRSGKLIVPMLYERAEPYYEGLACVGRKNEFGEVKYGFIDKQGKEVVPFQFSNKPSNFSHGLALVTPVKKEEFNYAYIDKEGKLLYKIKNAPSGKELTIPVGSNGEFVNGYSRWEAKEQTYNYYLMDTTGKLINENDFLASFGIDQKKLWIPSNWLREAPFVQIYKKGVPNSVGFLNMKTGKTLPVIFGRSNKYDLFDPSSRRILTTRFDAKQGKNTLEGYVNEDGIYVIIQGERGKW